MVLAINCLHIDMKWVTVPAPVSKTEAQMKFLLEGPRDANSPMGTTVIE